MAHVDELFKSMCSKIINDNFSTTSGHIRTVWQDGSSAHTIKGFGFSNQYDLREEFPLLTLRKIGLKSAINEVLWIYQKKSTNIHDLKPHIWDSWADESGDIGKTYGYEVSKLHLVKTFDFNDAINGKMFDHVAEAASTGLFPSMTMNVNTAAQGNEVYMEIYMDQMDSVLYNLKYDPFNRRNMLLTFNFDNLTKSKLPPCVYNVIFTVTDEGQDKLVLNMMINQRSNDILAANAWNVAQYAALLMMVAQVSDMIPGRLVHNIADAHIYDKHIDVVKELITRDSYDAPIVKLNPNIKNFYEFTEDDFTIENYQHGEPVKGIPVAL